MNFEETLKAAGGFGLYQWIILLFYQVGIFGIGSNMIFMIFGGYVKKCTVSSSTPTVNSTSSQLQSALINNSLSLDRHYQLNGTNQLDNSVSCDTYFYSIVDEWGLNTDSTKHIAGLVLTIQMFGVFFGPLVGGQVADTFGRRVAVLIGYTMMSICGVASAFCTNWQMFAVVRFLIGFFGGSISSAFYVLFVEVVPSKSRQAAFFGGWPLAFIYTGCIAYGTRNWRYMSLAINAIGIVPIALLVFWVTESPKWLLENNRLEEAKGVFEYIAKRNGSRVSQKLLDQQLDALLIKAHKNASAKVEKKKYSYHDLFRGWKRAIYTLTLCFCCFAISSITYIIILGLGKLAGDPAINTMFSGLVRVPLQAIAAGLDRKAKWFGRRQLHQTGLLLAAVCLFAMSGLLMNNYSAMTGLPYAALSMLTVGFGSLIWMAVQFYQQEIFPTALRTMGNAVCSCSSRIGNILAGQILILEQFWLPLPNIAMAGLVLVNSVLVFFVLPETKGKPLPDFSSHEQDNSDTKQTEMLLMEKQTQKTALQVI